MITKKSKPKVKPYEPPTHEELIAFIEGYDLVRSNSINNLLRDREEKE